MQRLRRLREQELAGKVKVVGADITHVKCLGKDTLVGVATAMLTGEPIRFEILDAEAALRLEQWLKDLVRLLGAEILVTDDADGLKTVADHLGLKHQICRAHVNRNVHDLIAALGTKALGASRPCAVGIAARDGRSISGRPGHGRMDHQEYAQHRANAVARTRRTLSRRTATQYRQEGNHVVSDAFTHLGLVGELGALGVVSTLAQ